jgi:D-alanyl-D-alanine carboxypeptidase/D-alanyl-D-alanine-endopeptidase (penicillin-binding protein 4)
MLLHRKRALAALVLLFFVQTFAATPKKAPHKPQKKTLAGQIKSLLAQPPLERAHWGILVKDLKTGVVIYSLNPEQLFVPASNVKLFTTAAALSLAKPDYRFLTSVETEGAIDSNGRLQGDLVVVGRGDPNISGRVLPYALKTERTPPHTQILEELADQVAAHGLKIVDGDLIGDDTFYSSQRYGEGWAQDDLQWIDGAPVSALTFNDNVLFLNIQPGDHEGDKALVTTEPETNYYEIDNRIVTTLAGITRKIGMHRDVGSRKILLWGNLPLGDAGFKEALGVDDPAEFTAQLFRTMLERRGITVTGKTRARHGDIAQFFDLSSGSATTTAALGKSRQPCCTQAQQPAGPSPTPTPTSPVTVLAEHFSLPFLEDVRVINKTSQNLHAELALRLVGRLGGQGGSFEGGAYEVKQFLLQAGLNQDDFVLLDGSGLSRRDLVTPAAVVQLLTYAAHQPWGADYEGTLPIAGVDGSLSERFLNSPASGLIHAKTGTLSHVNALSGYGQTLRGRRFAFSIFCNNHNLPSAKVLAAIDSIVTALVNAGGRAK